MFLPDVNVWLALAFEAHFHHKAARVWFDSLGPGACAFCRFTQQGFLRLATNPSVLKEEALTLAEAWAAYDELRRDERILFLAEPDGVEGHWRTLTGKRTYSHKIWSDAYLVAFARCAGAGNVTFDTGFRDYKDSSCLVLE